MNRLIKLFYTFHRLLGTVLSILFLVWFLSGFVMLYHGFPKVTLRDKYEHQDALSVNMPDLNTIVNSVPNCDSITNITLTTRFGRSLFKIETKDSLYQFTVDTLQNIVTDKYKQIEKYAYRWSSSDIEKVDTLYELDQWIPYGKLRSEFPIYKFHFADTEKSQLYISSKSGDALQFTNKNSRFWAWMGPIPHWVYFTGLRQNSQLWIDVVVWLSGIGALMCLAGLVLGVYVIIKRYKNKKRFELPYRKFVYKWHHITGFVFGLFVFTFVFSGMMSLVEIPQWLVKVHNPSFSADIYKRNSSIALQNYRLDYRELLTKYPDLVKSIEWSSFGEVPIYQVVIGDSMQVFDASSDKVLNLNLNEDKVVHRLLSICDKPMRIDLINEYDNYYYHRKNNLPLPVFKIEVEDADKSVLYINPKTSEIRYFNNNTRFRKWTYQALHSFNIKYLYDRPVLWNLVMWISMIGGTLVPLTGVWLGWRFCKRKVRSFTKRCKKK